MPSSSVDMDTEEALAMLENGQSDASDEEIHSLSRLLGRHAVNGGEQ